MTDHAAILATVAADPSAANIGMLADWLDNEGRATWEQVQHNVAVEHDNVYCRSCGKMEEELDFFPCIDRTKLPLHQQPPHLTRIAAEWMARWVDERKHGVGACSRCNGDLIVRIVSHAEQTPIHKRISRGSGHRGHKTHARTETIPPDREVICPLCERNEPSRSVPTFALLFDRPDVCRNCCGDKSVLCDRCQGKDLIIPGHVTMLADLLAKAGDPRADVVRGVRCCQVAGGGIAQVSGWWVFQQNENARSLAVYDAYADACREVCRRIRELMVEDCPHLAYDGGYPGIDKADLEKFKTCQRCFGLGWWAKGAK